MSTPTFRNKEKYEKEGKSVIRKGRNSELEKGKKPKRERGGIKAKWCRLSV